PLSLPSSRVAVSVTELVWFGSLLYFDQFVTRRNHSDTWFCVNQDRRFAVSRQQTEISQPNAPARSQNQFALTRFSAAAQQTFVFADPSQNTNGIGRNSFAVFHHHDSIRARRQGRAGHDLATLTALDSHIGCQAGPRFSDYGENDRNRV